MTTRKLCLKDEQIKLSQQAVQYSEKSAGLTCGSDIQVLSLQPKIQQECNLFFLSDKAVDSNENEMNFGREIP